MKSPLNHIRKWYSALPADIQKQFSATIATYHYEPSICLAGSDHETTESILRYLEDKNEPYSLVIAKCLFMAKLVSFGIFEINRSNYWGKIISNIESHGWSEAGNSNLRHELIAISNQSRLDWGQWQKLVKTWVIISSRYLTDECILDYKEKSLMRFLKSKYDQKQSISSQNRSAMRINKDCHTPSTHIGINVKRPIDSGNPGASLAPSKIH